MSIRLFQESTYLADCGQSSISRSIKVMTTYLLVRHGNTDAVNRTITGWLPGVGVNAAGREEIAAMAAALRSVNIAAVYSSPLERAMDTAAAIANARSLSVVADEALGEVRTGSWTGRALDELQADENWRRWNAVRSIVRAPGGETAIEIQSRMLDALTRLRQAHENQIVAIVSHGDPIRAIVAHAAGVPLDLSLRLRIDTASVSIVRFGDWAPEILGVNLRAGGFSWLNQTSGRS
jgi:probable phosphoglycerate mutase